MTLFNLFLNHREEFYESVDDLPWKDITKALDDGDSLLAARIMKLHFELMADSVEDELPNTADEEVDRRINGVF